MIVYRFLYQRMRARDHLDTTIFKTRKHLAPRRNFHPTRQQAHCQLRKEALEAFIVLVCQNLRRYHHGRLVARCDRCVHGKTRHRRLPAPHIALQ